MGIPSASYSITMRVHLGADPLGIGRITTAVGESAGTVVAVDIVESHPDLLVVDLTCNAVDARHADAITKAVGAIPGADVHAVSDRTFLLHLGGKLEVAQGAAAHRDDLSMAYTPGVARVCRAIAANPADARKLTIKQHGGRGHRRLGRARAGQHRPRGRHAGDGGQGPAVQAVRRGRRLAGLPGHPGHRRDRPHGRGAVGPWYGGVNLEDIAAPRYFEVERRLRESLDIPVFHDDQHGTAIVVLAALANALRVVGKELGGVRVVLSGSGAAGVAIIKILQAEGLRPRRRAPQGPRGLDESKQVADHTNPGGQTGTLRDALAGADVSGSAAASSTPATSPMGRRRDRVRPGQPRPGGRPGRRPPPRRRGRHRGSDPPGPWQRASPPGRVRAPWTPGPTPSPRP